MFLPPFPDIVQSGRLFLTGLKQHTSQSATDGKQLKIANHLFNNKHSVDDIKGSLRILHKCKKSLLLDIFKEFEMYKAFKSYRSHLLNEQLRFK